MDPMTGHELLKEGSYRPETQKDPLHHRHRHLKRGEPSDG
jgi:hypothetical protein